LILSAFSDSSNISFTNPAIFLPFFSGSLNRLWCNLSSFLFRMLEPLLWSIFFAPSRSFSHSSGVRNSLFILSLYSLILRPFNFKMPGYLSAILIRVGFCALHFCSGSSRRVKSFGYFECKGQLLIEQFSKRGQSKKGWFFVTHLPKMLPVINAGRNAQGRRFRDRYPICQQLHHTFVFLTSFSTSFFISLCISAVMVLPCLTQIALKSFFSCISTFRKYNVDNFSIDSIYYR